MPTSFVRKSKHLDTRSNYLCFFALLSVLTENRRAGTAYSSPISRLPNTSVVASGSNSCEAAMTNLTVAGYLLEVAEHRGHLRVELALVLSAFSLLVSENAVYWTPSEDLIHDFALLLILLLNA